MYNEILYHGTKNRERLIKEGFSKEMFFSGNGRMKWGLGFYASKYEDYAAKFGVPMRVSVSLKNPYLCNSINDYKKLRQKFRRKDNNTLVDYIKSLGYDGIVYKKSMEVCVFDAENIKIL